MCIHNLLIRMESTSGSLVTLKQLSQGTLEIQETHEGSPCSPSSLSKNQENYNFIAEATLSITLCKRAYRRPFGAGGYYKFPS